MLQIQAKTRAEGTWGQSPDWKNYGNDDYKTPALSKNSGFILSSF